MSANFTETDRKFIRKIATANASLEKRVKKLELESAVSTKAAAKAEPVPQISAQKKFKGNSSIEVTFAEPEEDIKSHQVLMESIYQTLRDICYKNNIESMDIFIDGSH